MDIGQRVRRARKHAGLTQEELAKAVDMKQPSLSELERGLSRSSAHLFQIATACGVSVEWIATGEGEMLREVSGQSGECTVLSDGEPGALMAASAVEVPVFREIEIPGGVGKTKVVKGQPPEALIPCGVMGDAGVSKEHAAAAHINDDSMGPGLPKGSVVGVNTSNLRLTDGKLYVIDHGGLLRVKQLYRIPGGGLRIRSFSPNKTEFPDEDVGPEWPGEVKILGRIFWSSTIWKDDA